MDHSTYTDCNLHVNTTSRAHHMTYMKLKANYDRDEAAVEPSEHEDTISTSSTSL